MAKITIPDTGTMLFEFADGTALEHHWSRNAKKESWTAERRKAVLPYVLIFKTFPITEKLVLGFTGRGA